MSANTDSNGDSEQSTPLLESRDDGHGEEQQVTRTQQQGGGGWWNKVLNLDEVKAQLRISVPMILTNMFYYLIPLVSVMYAGHLGEVQLAGATLANSWNVVTGVALMVTLSVFYLFSINPAAVLVLAR